MPAAVRRRLAALLLGAVALLAPAAPAAAADLAGLRAVLQRETAKLGPSSGALVVDLDRGTELYARRPDLRLIPASNEKLYVTAAALRVLGPEATVPTIVRLGPGTTLDADGVVRGDLFLVGGGDPSLGEAGLRDLAEQVSDAGVERVRGGVVGDESVFDARRGSSASAFRPDLDIGGWLGGLVWARGRTSPGGAPAVSAASRLQSLLKADGVRFGRRARQGTVPAEPRQAGAPEAPDDEQAAGVPGATLATHLSPPVRSLAATVNQPSDNFYAEMLVKLLGARAGAAGSTGQGLRVVRTELRELGVRPTLRDGSGLSRANRTSPRQVVTLLRALHADRALAAPFRASLAMPGRLGTLRKRMRGTAAVGRCPAKTGTLRGVSALSGYCTTTGGARVAFAFIENRVYAPGAKRIEDRMVPAIARYAP